MNQKFKFLLVLKSFLFWSFAFNRNALFVGEKVVEFSLLRLNFGVDQLALGMAERDLHKAEVAKFYY